MANGTILVKAPGQLMPEKAYEAASKGATSQGCAIAADGELLVQRTPDVQIKEKFLAMMEEYKSFAVVNFFGQREKNAEDFQPITILETKGDGTGDPLLVAFYDGDFDQHKAPKTTRSAEYQLSEKIMTMADTYAEEAGDNTTVEGFLEWLDKKENREILETSAKTRGDIILLSSEGTIKTFSNNKEGGKFEWGYLSSLNGYSEKEYPEKQESKAKSAFSRHFGKKPEEKVEEKKEEKTVLHKPEPEKKTDTAVVNSEGCPPGKVWVRPIAEIRKNDKRLKGWNEAKLGGLIKGWKERAEEWVALDALKVDATCEQKDATALADALRKAQNGEQFKKDVVPAHIAVHTVPPKQLEWFTKQFQESSEIKKALTGTGGAPTLAELEEDEKKHATWFDKTQTHLETTFKWPDTKLFELISSAPHLALKLHKALFAAYVKALNEHKQEDKEEAPAAPVKRVFGRK